ncbi:MAG: pre-peptidase C-terminal domain-containing protein [Rhizobiaceae bacterium]|nr:pre-peptidase C-terminal domain-containing protein [Rhizobiaceae bacterium]
MTNVDMPPLLLQQSSYRVHARLGLGLCLSLVLSWFLAAVQPALAQEGDTKPRMQIDMHIIGFAVSSSTQKQLADMAAAGGGSYYDSDDEGQLTQALGEAVGVTKPQTGSAPLEPTESVESEPNNAHGSADIIAADGTIEGRIQAAPSDTDWFRLMVLHQGQLSVAAADVPQQRNVNVSIFDANFKRIAGPIELKKGDQTSSIIADLPKRGMYWLQTTGAKSGAADAENYKLRLSFLATVDKAEPNDSRATATPLTPTGSTRGNILPMQDVDWYKVEVTKQGELDVKLTNIVEPFDLVVQVWDENGSKVGPYFVPDRPGGDTSAIIDLPQPGPYWIQVYDNRQNARSITPYTLTTNFTPTADVGEPNDRFAQPHDISIGTDVEANILPVGDVDWYAIAVDKPGALDLKLGNVADNLDLITQVWDTNKVKVGPYFSPARAGGETIGKVDLPVSGRYLIQVYDNRSNARAAQPYTLKTLFTPAQDAAEPNNSFAQSAPLAINSTVSANILPQGDVDWFEVTVPDAGALAVTISNVDEAMDLIVQAWTPDKDKLGSWYGPPRPGGDTSAVIDLPAPGRYFLQIYDNRSNARSEKPYSLTTEFTASEDQSEPNNRPALATSLTIDAEVKANIIPTGDRDWFAIDVADRGLLDVEISEVDVALDLYVQAWNADLQKVAGYFGPPRHGGDTLAAINLPAPGRYYLEVWDGRDNARSTTPYRLATRFSSASDKGEPNDTLATALPSALPNSTEGTIFPVGDSDLYRVETGGAGTLTLAVTNSAQNLDIAMTLLGADGKRVSFWFSPTGPGGDTNATVELSEAGIFYVLVRDGRNDASSDQPYSLAIDFSGPLPSSPSLAPSHAAGLHGGAALQTRLPSPVTQNTADNQSAQPANQPNQPNQLNPHQQRTLSLKPLKPRCAPVMFCKVQRMVHLHREQMAATAAAAAMTAMPCWIS